ncbi:hypothetical protein [Aeromonas dhakensis]|uniref:hypothetical protein n=1 Tax=Aeromonas dhakensis TaxID=196024 RepID=UPI001BDE558C|nr:hypothetical protein [Aeromonas dhakensis]
MSLGFCVSNLAFYCNEITTNNAISKPTWFQYGNIQQQGHSHSLYYMYESDKLHPSTQNTGKLNESHLGVLMMHKKRFTHRQKITGYHRHYLAQITISASVVGRGKQIHLSGRTCNDFC